MMGVLMNGIESVSYTHLRMQRSRSPSKTVRCSSFLLSFRFSQARKAAAAAANKAKEEAEKKAAAPAEESTVDFTHEEEIDFRCV